MPSEAIVLSHLRSDAKKRDLGQQDQVPVMMVPVWPTAYNQPMAYGETWNTETQQAIAYGETWNTETQPMAYGETWNTETQHKSLGELVREVCGTSAEEK